MLPIDIQLGEWMRPEVEIVVREENQCMTEPIKVGGTMGPLFLEAYKMDGTFFMAYRFRTKHSFRFTLYLLFYMISMEMVCVKLHSVHLKVLNS